MPEALAAEAIVASAQDFTLGQAFAIAAALIAVLLVVIGWLFSNAMRAWTKRIEALETKAVQAEKEAAEKYVGNKEFERLEGALKEFREEMREGLKSVLDKLDGKQDKKYCSDMHSGMPLKLHG